MTLDTVLIPSFSTRLRDETAEAHTAAENQPFVADMVKGLLPVVDFALLTAQHHAIYSALETAVADARHEQVSRFQIDGLARRAPLEADLEFFAGPGWRLKLPVLSATQIYADHIGCLASGWSQGLVAHQYIRYMGDLSGGQLIKRVAQRVYRLESGEGTSFYEFPEISSAKVFKATYRQMLDELNWDETDKARLVEEVQDAFRHHSEIYRELQALR